MLKILANMRHSHISQSGNVDIHEVHLLEAGNLQTQTGNAHLYAVQFSHYDGLGCYESGYLIETYLFPNNIYRWMGLGTSYSTY